MQLRFFLAASAASISLACGMVAAPALAQETTSIIRGSVTASDGSPVTDAEIKITHVPSGTVSTTRSGADGGFVASGLRVGGPYTVEVTSSQGNRTITDIYTVVQQDFQLPIELGGGETGSEIVVTASSIKGAGVTSDGPQTVLSAQDIAKVASVNRDIRDVERRDPFASLDITNQDSRGGAVSFAGVNPRFNRFTINGVTVGDTFGLDQDASPNIRGPVPLDALAQVSVSIAPYDIVQSGFQGGAIDTVLKSGTNQFHGTGFYSQNTDSLSGKKTGNLVFTPPKFKSETYGATISGPIIPGKLFFMLSGERNTDPRPYPTQIASYANPTLMTTAIGDVTSRATARSLVPGDILTINSRRDEKFAGRIDWNITDNQRLALSYVNSYNVQGSQNNTSSSSNTYGLSTNAYQLSELLHAGIAQLNSDWSDKFSTEVRLIRRWSRRGQEPFGGRPNGQFQVCDDATSVGSATGCTRGTTGATNSPVITFGPDNFRQTNQLSYDTWEGSILGRLQAGDHSFKALFDVTRNHTFNNFVPNSLGSWYFDSLADFAAGKANQVQYSAVIGSDPKGAAANFAYTSYAFGLEDEWHVTPTFEVTAGIRYTLYGESDRPVLNPYFVQRYGYSNLKTYKGLDQIEPRLSFNWKPDNTSFRLRGGVGIFGGGAPDIFLSNSFSNTVTINSLTITRDATCATTGSLCDLALNNVTGQIPAALAAAAGNTTGSTTLPKTVTWALSPDFHLPRSLKATLSADYKLFGFDIGADGYYSNTLDGVGFADLRSVKVGTLPDGRPRYQNTFFGQSDGNFDILVRNTHEGRSLIGVLRFDKKFDWGLSFGGSYTYQDVKDVGDATSSTASSNYRNQIFADPNFPAYGISDNQIRWAWKYHLGFDHAFFGDYRTVFQLFGETRAGRPFSYTMIDNLGGSGRTSVFGTPLTGATSSPTNLLYVPTGINDPLVQYDSAATGAALDSFIGRTNLAKYRGQIAPKNIGRNKAFTQLDLHLEQQIPAFIGSSRFTIFADINNFPNLLNKNWGSLSQYIGFPYAASVVQVNCVTASGTVVPSSAAIGSTANPATGCVKYQYSKFQDPTATSSTNFTGSLYAIRIGARFTF